MIKLRLTPCCARCQVDPTGCGDAFRAGFIFGLENKWSLIDAAKLGSVLGSIKVGSQGTQKITFSLKKIYEFI